MSITKNNLLLLFSGLLVTFFIYLPGLSSGLMLDDGPQIMPIMHSVTTENWTTEFKQFVLSNSGFLGRPIPMSTFIINAALFGKNIWYWKLTNVIFHGLSGLAVFFLTKVLLSFDNSMSSSKLKWISFSISLLWLIHPLHISTVLYLVQRMTILATLFIFLALACFTHGIKKECQRKNGKYYFFCALFLFFPLAILCKESGVMFPVFALLINQHLLYRNIYTEDVRQRVRPYIVILWSILILGFIGFIYLFENIITENYHFREFTLSERFLTQGRVIFLYLQQIVFPTPSSMGFYHDDIEISKNITSPFSTLFSIIGILLILGFLITQFKKLGLLALGCLFFFSSHLLESTFLPLEIAFEHRNYIGSWGVILAVVHLLLKLSNKYFYSGIILLALILSGLTFYRSTMWGDPSLMYPHMLAIHPQSLRLKIIFADSYFQAGQYNKADSFLAGEKGLGVNLQRINIRCVKTKKIKNHALLQLVNKTHKIGTYEMEGIIALANRGLDEECQLDKQTFLQFLQSIIQFPIVDKVAEQKILLYTAHYHYALNQLDLALATLEDSYTKDTSNPIPLFLKIDWLIENKRYQAAEQVFILAKISADKSWHNYSEFVTNASIALAQKDNTKNEKIR